MGNIYFELTKEFNARGLVAVLTSGQAVVFYRAAIMSKDGDWVIRETEAACRHVLSVLGRHGARYRPGAPLDVRWLASGWSSHFEFADDRGRRVRCDFLSRPPRVPTEAIERLFASDQPHSDPAVIDLELLLAMKRTQRAKDYAVIGELARLLPPERELAFTTDPDRVLALALEHGEQSTRACVQAARRGDGREAVVVALARETDAHQQRDHARLAPYETAARPYLAAFRQLPASEPLAEAHPRVVALAEACLPVDPGSGSGGSGEAQEAGHADAQRR